MAKVYVTLSRTGTVPGVIIGECIKLYRSKEIGVVGDLERSGDMVIYSHASISLDKKLNKMYSFARKKIRNPLNAGFVQEDIRSGMFARKTKAQAAVFEIEVTVGQMEYISHRIEYLSINKGKYKYNFASLLSVLVGGVKMKLSDRYCCSQFVAQLLANSGAQVFERDISVMTPFDLYYALTKAGRKRIYKGLLRDYIYSKS